MSERVVRLVDKLVRHEGHSPEYTVVAAVHADRMMGFLFLLFLTLLLTNTSDLALFKVFLCMSIDISIQEEIA